MLRYTPRLEALAALAALAALELVPKEAVHLDSAPAVVLAIAPVHTLALVLHSALLAIHSVVSERKKV